MYTADSDKPSTNNTLSTTSNDDGKSKHYCEVCHHQAKNKKEYNDHLNSNDHLLADKMARFCEATETTVQPGWYKITYFSPFLKKAKTKQDYLFKTKFVIYSISNVLG